MNIIIMQLFTVVCVKSEIIARYTIHLYTICSFNWYDTHILRMSNHYYYYIFKGIIPLCIFYRIRHSNFLVDGSNFALFDIFFLSFSFWKSFSGLENSKGIKLWMCTSNSCSNYIQVNPHSYLKGSLNLVGLVCFGCTIDSNNTHCKYKIALNWHAWLKKAEIWSFLLSKQREGKMNNILNALTENHISGWSQWINFLHLEIHLAFCFAVIWEVINMFPFSSQIHYFFLWFLLIRNTKHIFS